MPVGHDHHRLQRLPAGPSRGEGPGFHELRFSRHLHPVLAAGIEPATPCLQGRCSSKLSYASKSPAGCNRPVGLNLP